MSVYYILKDRKPVPVESLEEWAKSYDITDRHVARDKIGDVEISTVFMGVNHRIHGDGPPLVFETMIFGGAHDWHKTRASTWEEAEQQHAVAVAIVRSGLN